MRALRMKRRAIFLAALAAAAVMGAAACENPIFVVLGSKGWGLLGTWGNASYYSSTPPQCRTLTVRADGTYTGADSTGITTSGTYTVDSSTISGSSRTYQIDFQYVSASLTYHFYSLVRITNETSWESNGSGFLPYPSVIDSGGGGYATYTLQ